VRSSLSFAVALLIVNVLTAVAAEQPAADRNDASPARGQWQLDNACRYLSEACGGYHFDALNGSEVRAGAEGSPSSRDKRTQRRSG